MNLHRGKFRVLGRGPGAPGKYRWDAWFRKPVFTIRKGKDYGVSQSAMAGMLRNAASVRGLSVRVEDVGDRLHVIVRGRVGERPELGGRPRGAPVGRAPRFVDNQEAARGADNRLAPATLWG